MKIQALKTAVTSNVSRQVLHLQKHSPKLLFGVGVAGMVATTVLASRATLKLNDIFSEAEADRDMVETVKHPKYSEQDRTQDLVIIKVQTVKKIVKLYAPAVLMGAFSVAALTSSHVILTKRNAGLAAAYAALAKGFDEYRQRVRDELGDDKDLQFRHGVGTVTEVVVDENGKSKTVEHSVLAPGLPSIYARYFDEASKSWDRHDHHNQIFLKCQQNYANDLLRARGHVFLNEVYDLLGMERSSAGAVVGWVDKKDGSRDNYIDFGIFDDVNLGARFVNGATKAVLLDFNVDGVIYDLIEESR